MARDPTQFRHRKAEYLTKAVENGEVTPEDADRIRDVVHAFDENKPTVKRPAWPDAPSNIRGYRSETTLGNWLYFLTRAAKHTSLRAGDATAINQVAEDMLSGSSPHVKDDGLSKGSIRAYQNTLRIFYRYHDDLGLDWSDVAVFSRTKQNGSGGSSWEPDDILDRAEIDACQAAATDYRDAAVFNLLLYTGMRNRALRTLRIRDVDPEDGTYRLNPAEGTKDLDKPRAPRPLFAAKAPVREWLKRHPTPDDKDAYLITANSKYTTPDPTEPVSDRTVERVCDRIKEEAGVDKPLHPHMLRHNFVYICKRVYELNDDTIRFYLGHAEDSTIMEETYSHLSAEDHLERGRVAAGEIDPDDDDVGFELETCNVCGEHLPEGAKACPKCGTVFTPDAQQAKDRIQSALFESLGETDDEELKAGLEELHAELQNDPARSAEVLEQVPELKRLLDDES